MCRTPLAISTHFLPQFLPTGYQEIGSIALQKKNHLKLFLKNDFPDPPQKYIEICCPLYSDVFLYVVLYFPIIFYKFLS